MLPRRAKAAFYFASAPLMRCNAFIYKNFRHPDGSQKLKLHLGPGQKKYIDKWINVDANMFTAKCDVWSDLRYPLPFRDGVASAVYSHHVIEHLPDLKGHLQDVYRCLAPGGVYRVAGPNGDSAISKFIANDKSWFGDWPEKRSSIGGRFENFIFCKGEHLTILTDSFLRELLSDAGFRDIRSCVPANETFFPDLFSDCLPMEHEDDFEFPHTLIMEAVKA